MSKLKYTLGFINQVDMIINGTYLNNKKSSHFIIYNRLPICNVLPKHLHTCVRSKYASGTHMHRFTRNPTILANELC